MDESSELTNELNKASRYGSSQWIPANGGTMCLSFCLFFCIPLLSILLYFECLPLLFFRMSIPFAYLFWTSDGYPFRLFLWTLDVYLFCLFLLDFPLFGSPSLWQEGTACGSEGGNFGHIHDSERTTPGNTTNRSVFISIQRLLAGFVFCPFILPLEGNDVTIHRHIGLRSDIPSVRAGMYQTHRMQLATPSPTPAALLCSTDTGGRAMAS